MMSLLATPGRLRIVISSGEGTLFQIIGWPPKSSTDIPSLIPISTVNVRIRFIREREENGRIKLLNMLKRRYLTFIDGFRSVLYRDVGT